MTIHILRHGFTLCGKFWPEVAMGHRWLSFQDSEASRTANCTQCRETLSAASFTCPKCHRTSFNPNGYCRTCHDFTGARP